MKSMRIVPMHLRKMPIKYWGMIPSQIDPSISHHVLMHHWFQWSSVDFYFFIIMSSHLHWLCHWDWLFLHSRAPSFLCFFNSLSHPSIACRVLLERCSVTIVCWVLFLRVGRASTIILSSLLSLTCAAPQNIVFCCFLQTATKKPNWQPSGHFESNSTCPAGCQFTI